MVDATVLTITQRDDRVNGLALRRLQQLLRVISSHILQLTVSHTATYNSFWFCTLIHRWTISDPQRMT